MKKVFIISVILFGVTLLIWGVYNFAFKKSDNSVMTTTQKEQQVVQLPKTNPVVVVTKPEKIVPVSKEPVLGAVADKKTEKISFYSALDGTVWQIDTDGLNLIQTASVKLSGLVGANWSPDKTKVLTTFNKDGKNIFFTYDNVKKVGVQLKENLDSVVWDGLGGKIIYKYYDAKTKKRSLSIANPDGSDWQTIIGDIPFRKISMSAVPLTSVVSFWNFPSASEESVLQLVSSAGGEVKNIFKGQFGGDYLWSPDGSQALVSSLKDKNEKTLMLGLVSFQGEYRELGIPTMVSKCVWSIDGKNIYCALPGGIPTGSIMPDDYQSKKFTTNDTFWKINTVTGSKERIVELTDINDVYDVATPFLSSTEDSLFFINRLDGKLYRVGL